MQPSLDFVYQSLPHHVLFGAGKLAEVKSQVERVGSRRAMVLSTPGQEELARRVAGLLGEWCVAIHPHAIQHVPYETVKAAMKDVHQHNVDLLVAVGGGSTVGLAKGVALETKLPILAIPTTYAGSEMTHIWGISKDGHKTTGRDSVVKPACVIYDPELIVSLPPAMSLTSGVNAMAHAVEALYAQNQSPIASMMAEESIRQLALGLPRVVAQPGDVEARATSMYGAWLAACVLDMVGMALHHKLCHTLGGSFGMPHAETHTVILPYAIAYNASSIGNALSRMARALGCEPMQVASTVQELSRQNGGPTSLRELGFEEKNLQRASELAAQKSYPNPRPVVQEDILFLLQQAWSGALPQQA
ncbi:MAG: maleylacetate reductase [Deltaproteobacteria bacterium]|nr:MAG: maleylacetate reductase [Deltaproteobacteria bacterium]